MTNQYLRNSVADHITGAISACEGIRNNLVILNGPIGCKTYYTFSGVDSVVRRSDLWSLRGELQLEDAMDDHLLRSQYCVGSARTPAGVSPSLIVFLFRPTSSAFPLSGFRPFMSVLFSLPFSFLPSFPPLP